MIITIATTEQLTDKQFVRLALSGHGFTALTGSGGAFLPLRGSKHESIVLVSNRSHLRGKGHVRRRTDGSRYIITAIYLIDDDITTHVLTVDLYERAATDISHLGATEHLTVEVACIYLHRSLAAKVTGISAAIHIATNLDLALYRHRQ